MNDAVDESIPTVPVDPTTLQALLELRGRAWAPYSGFRVAALIDCPDGSRFGGCNVETSHYKSICAEAAAISAMVAAGRHRIRRAWILADGQSGCPPCGDCRQRLFEFAAAGGEVLLVDEAASKAQRWPIDALLPAAFRLARTPQAASE